MGNWIAQALWLSLPIALTGVLHMVVVSKNLFPSVKIPIDGGCTFRGKPIFGANKTWRGVLFMTIAAALIGAVQGAIGGDWAAQAGAAALDFANIGAPQKMDTSIRAFASGYAIVNAVLGLGYVLGELPNSFLKRQLAIAPGKTGAGALGALFFLVDQADSVIAPLGLAVLIFGLDVHVFVVGLVILSGLHLIINVSLYFARLRKNL